MMTPTDSRVFETLYALGRWLMDQSRSEDAAHVFRTMILMMPQDERGWLGLGNTHEHANDIEVACAIYSLGEKTVASSYRCPLAKARLLRSRQEDDATDVAYELAFERAANHGDQATALSIQQEWRTG